MGSKVLVMVHNIVVVKFDLTKEFKNKDLKCIALRPWRLP